MSLRRNRTTHHALLSIRLSFRREMEEAFIAEGEAELETCGGGDDYQDQDIPTSIE